MLLDGHDVPIFESVEVGAAKISVAMLNGPLAVSQHEHVPVAVVLLQNINKQNSVTQGNIIFKFVLFVHRNHTFSIPRPENLFNFPMVYVLVLGRDDEDVLSLDFLECLQLRVVDDVVLFELGVGSA